MFLKNSTKYHYEGCEFKNWKGGKCTAFRGIPYAKPPINGLRFKDPQPIENPTTFVDARNDGPDCSSTFGANFSEDCLFLNIYSKSWEPYSENHLRPVIFFIHPGGFYLGTGASSFLGPEYLLEKDIILVTFNYRLGAMGFLNLGTPDIPGNAGLKDQVMALRWVNDNIEYFGGDPKQITLMGYSAGGFSVCLHLVSPMSQGLFQRAVIMSASIPPQSKIPRRNQIELAKKQAKLMGCDMESSSLKTENDRILECLSQFEGLEISKTFRKMFHYGNDNPIYLWLPVIEKKFGQERFLIEDPYKSFKSGRFAKVPLLIGFTTGEFCTSAKDILTNELLLNQFKEEFNRISPICFMYSEHKNEANITQAILSEYLENFKNGLSEKDFENLCSVFSDSIIRFGVEKISNLASKHVNVYPYRFSYEGSTSFLHYPGHKAVEHMDDLMYLFKLWNKTFSPNDPESHIVENMVGFFTKFVENGKPDEDFEYKMQTFVEFGEKVEIRNGPYFEKYQFWENLTKY
ncbi:juvenile hormone esterase-like isoform X2 [Episyrphus balteatus]|uniref:juvenile hormone esterase-like isoform X2 n=1 Tax=Episyrphus balteatus TaxID=286459 RepID=UPI0024862517|nr:juvenile hormone esterase-like isoform X2 [Episyrphus balteatus]